VTIATSPTASRRPVSSAFLFRNSIWLFALFAAAMVAAFWPSYFSRLAAQGTSHAHQHGIAMLLWCALLVTQAALIRAGRRAAHRRAGLLSYALVPLIVVTTTRFIHFRLNEAAAIAPNLLYFLALVIDTLVAFLVLYGLAIYYRRRPAVHARYMVCTIVPFLPPITDRLIGFYQPALMALFPTIGPDPLLPLFGFALGDAMVAALAFWDWRANRRANVFPVALAILLGYQWLVVNSHRFAWWASVAEWFRALPLT